MRLVKLALALALGAALPAPAAAQVGLPPLAPGEVLLQVSGLGQVITPADRALLQAMIVGQGADRAAANRDAHTKLSRVLAALRAAGVADADVQTSEASGPVEVSTRILISTVASGERTDGATAFITLAISVREMRRLAAVRAALHANGARIHAPPEYFLANATGALWQARMAALRRARTDAETNAALRNMRIVRIARISERSGLWALGQLANEAETFSRLFSMVWRVQSPSSEVETFAGVAVDFVLVPQ